MAKDKKDENKAAPSANNGPEVVFGHNSPPSAIRRFYAPR